METTEAGEETEMGISEQLLQRNENTYHVIRASLVQAQRKLTSAVNSAMVTAYWEIGREIYRACGENDRAEYGKKLLRYLSERLTGEFGKGFDETNLRKMRQFYCCFPIRDTLCPELSWSHYRLLMRISDEKIRFFYMDECVKSAWSVRQLERNHLEVVERGITGALPDFNSLMYAVIKKK